VGRVKESFAGAPVKATAGFMFFISVVLMLMWLAMIIPPLVNGERPAELETYTTLVIQALDLGIIVPLAAITGTLLLKREAWGYALASLILIKVATLGTGVLSMALFMALDGAEIVVPQVIMLVVLTLGALALAVAYYGKMKIPAATVNAAAA
jgi:hypothetical protein